MFTLLNKLGAIKTISMQLKKFIKEIGNLKPTAEELNKAGIPLSEQDRWEIDVLDDEFNAYDGPLYQMVYCLDKLQLYSGLEQLSDMDEEAPEPFIIWGINTNYNFFYAFSYLSDEVVLLDDLKSAEPNMLCAASGPKFLDSLLVVAEAEKIRLLNMVEFEEKKEQFIEKAAKAAGGVKYKEHCKILIG